MRNKRIRISWQIKKINLIVYLNVQLDGYGAMVQLNKDWANGIISWYGAVG
jgi:hypothetical protein